MSQPKESFDKTLPSWRWLLIESFHDIKLAIRPITFKKLRYTTGMGGREINLKTKSTLLNESG